MFLNMIWTSINPTKRYVVTDMTVVYTGNHTRYTMCLDKQLTMSWEGAAQSATRKMKLVFQSLRDLPCGL